MNRKPTVRFTEIDEDSDFFEKMAKIMEMNNQTSMIVKRLSRSDALRILRKRQVQGNFSNITDTEEEESKYIYPRANSEEGKEKLQKLKRLVRFSKTRPDFDENSKETLFIDKSTGTYYQRETSYFKLKRKKPTVDGIKFDYYSVVLLHDVTRYVREEQRLLEDATTGVPSKKQLMPLIVDYISQAIVRKESFALTMLDIDFFKNINDTYGHQFGDGVLKELAQYVNRAVCYGDERLHGIIGRYGGEEFVFTLNDIGYEDAKKSNERIRAGIEKDLEVYENQPIKLTCSMGMVYVKYEQIKDIPPDDFKKIRSLANKVIKKADEKMYISKKSGRNRVTVVEYSSEKEKDIEEK